VPIPLKSKALSAVLAFLLLALGIPQTIDSVLWSMTGDTPDQLGKESPASPVEAASNATLLEKADVWTGDPKARIRAGILRLRLATGSGDQLDKDQLQHAVDDLTDGLARWPGDGFVWAVLAQARLATSNIVGAHQALTTSFLTDPNDEFLSVWRCELGLQLWTTLDANDRRLWNKQVIMAWDYHTRDLIELAWRNNSAYANPIRLALLSDPARFARFERALTEKRANP